MAKRLRKEVMDRLIDRHFTNIQPAVVYGLPPQVSKYFLKKYKIKLDENGRGTFNYKGSPLLISYNGVRCRVKRADEDLI